MKFKNMERFLWRYEQLFEILSNRMKEIWYLGPFHGYGPHITNVTSSGVTIEFNTSCSCHPRYDSIHFPLRYFDESIPIRQIVDELNKKVR